MDYLYDLNSLRGIDYRSPAPEMLQLLVLEILLKALLLLDQGGEPRSDGHSYSKIWSKISKDERRAVVVYANERLPHLKLSEQKVELALEKSRSIFVDYRYSYEKNERLGDRELAKKESDWSESGALPECADFIFFHEKLLALIYGLQQVLRQRMGIECDVVV